MDIKSHIMRFRANKKKKNRSNPLGTIGLLLAAIFKYRLIRGIDLCRKPLFRVH